MAISVEHTLTFGRKLCQLGRLLLRNVLKCGSEPLSARATILMTGSRCIVKSRGRDEDN